MPQSLTLPTSLLTILWKCRFGFSRSLDELKISDTLPDEAISADPWTTPWVAQLFMWYTQRDVLVPNTCSMIVGIKRSLKNSPVSGHPAQVFALPSFGFSDKKKCTSFLGGTDFGFLFLALTSKRNLSPRSSDKGLWLGQKIMSCRHNPAAGANNK